MSFLFIIKKFFLILLFTAFIFNLTALHANAVPDLWNKIKGDNTVLNPTQIKPPVENVSQAIEIAIEIVKWTYTIFFIVAVFMILVAAYNYLTAQAEPEKIKSATNQIIFAAVAVAIALIAVSFSLIIKSFFPGGTTETGGSASSPSY